MKRAIWNGTVSFGMVSIPVRLYTATRSKDVSLRLLHDECSTRVRELRWCPLHERPLAPNELVRGYEYAKDQFLPITEEDLERLPVPSKHTIALSAFVPAGEVDPVFFDKSYYLEADKLGVKPYALLLRSLGDQNMVALARITLRTRERLCTLRPHGGTLVLETLYFGDEVSVPQTQESSAVEVSESELAMASSLIELLKAPFDPDEYQDTYRSALEEMIAAKLQGQESAPPPEPQTGKVVDLMDALRASVEAAQKRREAEVGDGKRATARRAG